MKSDDKDQVHPMAIFYGPVELIGVGPFQVQDISALTAKFKETAEQVEQ